MAKTFSEALTQQRIGGKQVARASKKLAEYSAQQEAVLCQGALELFELFMKMIGSYEEAAANAPMALIYQEVLALGMGGSFWTQVAIDTFSKQQALSLLAECPPLVRQEMCGALSSLMAKMKKTYKDLASKVGEAGLKKAPYGFFYITVYPWLKKLKGLLIPLGGCLDVELEPL